MLQSTDPWLDLPILLDDDGFVHISELCRRAGKKFTKYRQYFGRQFIAGLQDELGFNPVKLPTVPRDGTYVHRRVLTDLAIWLALNFASLLHGGLNWL